MTKDELLQQVMEGSNVDDIHPLHLAIMEECCENAINNSNGVSDKKVLQFAVDIAFLSANTVLKATLQAALANRSMITLNFGGNAFEVNKNSALLN